MSVRPIALVSLDGLQLEATLHEAQGVSPMGGVVLAHGITVDLNEGGMFVRLAERLAGIGLCALRFSFRGHGQSAGTQRGVTIAGEMLDFESAVERMRAEMSGPIAIVAASFGAVATTLCLPFLEPVVSALALWNPVLDLRKTFLEPELPWGFQNFGQAQRAVLKRQGGLRVDDAFELGRVLFEEFAQYEPGAAFVASQLPALIVHGDKDSYVSYDVARAAAGRHPQCAFHTITGSEHGFDSREREDEAIAVTVDWLRRHLVAVK